jgi:hypothetical protein
VRGPAVSRTRFDVFPATGDVGFVEDGKQPVLGNAGDQSIAHLREGPLANRDALAQAGDLVRRLDGARPFRDLLAVSHVDAERPQRGMAVRIDAIDGEAAIAACRASSRGRLFRLPIASRARQSAGPR